MAIYDIFAQESQRESRSAACAMKAEPLSTEEAAPELPPSEVRARDRFFSSLTARLFFLILLIADLLWALYSLSLLTLSALLSLVTLRKVPYFSQLIERRWLAFKRSLICGLSLFVTLFSPSLGIMIACTYFLMYDKAGIEEVIPTSLQAQFKEFFKSS